MWLWERLLGKNVSAQFKLNKVLNNEQKNLHHFIKYLIKWRAGELK